MLSKIEDAVEGEVVEIEAVQALDPITMAEVDIAISTAHRFPRNLQRFKDRVASMATLDEETAESCFYSLRRAGKTIEGPSIRLAEIAASAYGNIRAGARILGDSPDGRFVCALGVCHDLEQNVLVQIEARRRVTKTDGRRYDDDMIGVTSNAAASVALRNAIFRVIPRALLRSAYLAAVKVATGDAKTLVERRERAFEKVRTLSPMLTEERILASIGRPSVDDVTQQDLRHLFGLHTAIKTGETTIDEAFPEQKVTPESLLGGKPKTEDEKGKGR